MFVVGRDVEKGWLVRSLGWLGWSLLVTILFSAPQSLAARPVLLSQAAQELKIKNHTEARQTLKKLEAQAAKLSKKELAQMHALWGIYHYYETGRKAAKQHLHKALIYHPKIALPAWTSRRIQQLMADLKRQAISHRKRPIPPRKRTTQIVQAQAPGADQPRVSPRPMIVVIAREVRPPPPKPNVWARHRTSLLLLGLGLAVAIAGGATGIWNVSAIRHFESLPPQTTDGKALSDAHNAATQSGIATAILLGTGGALGIAGISVLLYELSQPPTPKTTP